MRGGNSSRISSPTRKSRPSKPNGVRRTRRSDKFWFDIDRAAVLAVRERGQVVRCGRIDLKCTGAFLQLKLPSGRKISYPQPRLITEDGSNKHRVVFADNAAGQFKDCRNGQGAYAGMWTENIVSGIARDLLAAAMLRVEAAGYPIVLHVHDETRLRSADRFRTFGWAITWETPQSRGGRSGCNTDQRSELQRWWAWPRHRPY